MNYVLVEHHLDAVEELEAAAAPMVNNLLGLSQNDPEIRVSNIHDHGYLH